MPYRIQTPSGEGHYYGDVSRLNAPYNPSPGLYQYPSDGLGASSSGGTGKTIFVLLALVSAGIFVWGISQDPKKGVLKRQLRELEQEEKKAKSDIDYYTALIKEQKRQKVPKDRIKQSKQELADARNEYMNFRDERKEVADMLAAYK